MRNKGFIELRKQLVNKAKISKSPLLGHFELTARCNLNCKMCFVHNQNNSELLPYELSTDQWKNIFDEAYECGLQYASLSGGECLIRSDFKELYLHLWNKKVFVSVLTNGTLINQDYVDFFRSYPPDYIQISLYGSNEDGYLCVTGHKGFEKAISAINSLENAGIDVRVVATPSKYMGEDFVEIFRLCKESKYNIQYTDVTLMQNRDDPDKSDYFLTNDEIVSLLEKRALLYNALVPCSNTPEPFGPMTNKPVDGLVCNAGNCLAAVTWDGKMYACLTAMIGGYSLLEYSYSDAWKKVVVDSTRVAQGIECFGCSYEKACPKCPAFRLKDLKSGHCDPSVCDLTRKLVASGVKKLN